MEIINPPTLEVFMSRKRKYTKEIKTKACEDYLNGIRSPSQICQDLGLDRKWRVFGGLKNAREDCKGHFI